MHPSTVLYVGAGTDLPLVHLPSSSHRMVCVDGQPFSEFGVLQCDCHPASENCFSRSRFLAELDQSARREGLSVTRHDGEVREYGDHVRYYTNTSIPEHIDRLRSEYTFSTLLVRGHHPHRAVMDLLAAEGNTFLGFTGTIYRFDAADDETVVHLLHTCETTRARFRMFTLVADETTRIHCAEWSDFVRHVEEHNGRLPPQW